MKPKRWILERAVVVLLLGLVLWAFWEPEKDPLFEGKPLSKHLESCRVSEIGFGGGFRGTQIDGPPEPALDGLEVGPAREAILKVGTNAFPMLVRMLTWGETPVDQWLRLMVEKYGLPRKFMQTNWVAAWENPAKALAAFHTLGSNAAPAASRIVPLLTNPETAHKAIVALALIRPEREDHILSLTNVARIRKSSRTGATPDLLLSGALLALGSFGPKASNAMPFLIQSLSSTNERVQAAAAVALARVGAKAEEVVPLLIDTLPKTDPTPPPGSGPLWGPPSLVSETMMKLWALEQFGPKVSRAARTGRKTGVWEMDQDVCVNGGVRSVRSAVQI